MAQRIGELTVEELAALVCETLAKAGVRVTLSGGACVQIWSEGKYVSKDLDFIEEGPVPRRRVREALAAIGFAEKNRYFTHPETPWLVELPAGPLMVGDERVHRSAERVTAVGTLRLLTPTDCVKDRLAAFYSGTTARLWSRPSWSRGRARWIWRTCGGGRRGRVRRGSFGSLSAGCEGYPSGADAFPVTLPCSSFACAKSRGRARARSGIPGHESGARNVG